jgi:hypothetical protein
MGAVCGVQHALTTWLARRRVLWSHWWTLCGKARCVRYLNNGAAVAPGTLRTADA